jgi:predicted aldo/keto reductase-like oxidoreductase
MLTRRDLLKTLGFAGSVLAVNRLRLVTDALASSSDVAPATGKVPMRPLGKTGVQVSALCFGGAHWGRMKDDKEAIHLLHEAIDAGVTFLDNAWEYNQGRSEVLMGKALKGRRQEVFLMTKLCSHGRNKQFAMHQLEESLRRLKTDHLDLWQIHEVVYDDDPGKHLAPGGAAEALVEARGQGKVRFIGFTGHKHPKLHQQMLASDVPFDTCQLPLNVFDGSYRSFEHEVLPILLERGIAPLGMKSLSGNADPIKQKILTVEEALRYVLSLPVAAVVSGIDSRDVLRQNLDIVRRFTPMSAQERDTLKARVASYAMDGRFELFKSSDRYEGPIGREQHGLLS